LNKHFFILTHENAKWKIITDGLSRTMRSQIIYPSNKFDYQSWEDLENIAQYCNKRGASSFIHVVDSKNHITPRQFPGGKFLIYLGQPEVVQDNQVDIFQYRLRRLYEICFKYSQVKCINQDQILSGNYTLAIRDFFENKEYNVPGNFSEPLKGTEVSTKVRKYLSYSNWCYKNLPIMRPIF
jgi:hypothetical protein